MPHPPYLLRLGEATLVFFPPQAELGLHAPHVTQVMIKPQTAYENFTSVLYTRAS
jgi:hypothetical protein